MVRVDWNKFKAKFGDGSRQAFEDLSYSIFCREYELRTGVFRFRNHPALETEPILQNGKKIGFQAKFLEGKPSDCKQEIINAIHAVQVKYPGLNQLVFYLPFDFDCNSKGVGPSLVSSTQNKIEDEAAKTGLTIVWFCLSRFEAIFTRDEYDSIGRYYFSDELGVYAFADALEDKSEDLLASIKTFSSGGTVSFQADRTPIISNLKKKLADNLCIVYGEGGIGKSGLMKEIAEQFATRIVLRPAAVAEEFDPLRLKSIWHTDFDSLLASYNPDTPKLFVMDAAEKLENSDSQEFIIRVLSRFIGHGWSVLLTARSTYRQLLETLFVFHLNSPFTSIELPPLSMGELSRFSLQNGISLPADDFARDLLCIPFYLNAYLKTITSGMEPNYARFKQLLWDQVVGGGKSGDVASLQFIKLVETRVKNKEYWFDVCDSDSEIVHTLVQRQVLSLEDSTQRYFVAHDIYEEWALEHIIDRLYNDVPAEDFFNRMTEVHPLVRAYRLWLIDKLKGRDDLSELIEVALTDEKGRWFNETIIAVMLSPYASQFLQGYRSRLFEKNAFFLCKVIQCVMIACRTYNDLHAQFEGMESDKVLRYYFTKPVGSGWKALIDFLYDNKDSLHGFDLKDVVALLQNWCLAFPTSETTRKAGLLAFSFGEMRDGGDNTPFEIHHVDDALLIGTITAAAAEIKKDIKECIEFYLDNYDVNLVGMGRDIVYAVLKKPLEHIRFIKELPELTRRMARMIWLDLDRKNGWPTSIGQEETFGISHSFSGRHATPSAFSTPAYFLLRIDPVKTIDWIVDISNATIKHAVQSQDDIGTTQTTFSFPDGTKVRQYISNALWSCHRGSLGPVVPDLLQSVHMALEKFLLETHDAHPDWAPTIEALMLNAIKESLSASIAGVATSLVLAHPDEYFNLASVILTSRAAIRADLIRCGMGEPQCRTLYEIPSSEDAICRDERLETLKDEFRNKSLETVMVHYQLFSNIDQAVRKARMEFLLDGYSKLTDDVDRYFVFRTDVRKAQLFQTVTEKGQQAIGLAPVLPQELIDKQIETQNEQRPRQVAMSLSLWASAKMKGEPISENSKVYETDFARAIADFELLCHADWTGENKFFHSLIVQPAAVFLMFFFDQLEERIISQCKGLVLNYASLGLNDSYQFQMENGFIAAICALPIIVKHGTSVETEQANCLLLAAMLNEFPVSEFQRVCDLAFEAIRWYDAKWKNYGGSYIGSYISLRGLFQHYVHQNRNRLLSCRNYVGRFWQDKKSEIFSTVFGHEVRLKESLEDPFRFYGVLNSILLIADKQDSVSLNRSLILGTIAPALSAFYHPDDKGRKLSADRFTPVSTQYQRHLCRLLFATNDETRKEALKEITKVPLAFADDFLLTTLVLTADQTGMKEVFWDVWEALFDPIHQLVSEAPLLWRRNDENVMTTYLLGTRLWKKGIHEWRYFDNRGIDLFDRVSKEFPPSIPLALGFSSFACSIGWRYWKKCLFWISRVVDDNEIKSYRYDSSMKDLVFLLESFMCNLVAEHRTEVRKSVSMSDQAFVILDFMISQYSTVGYRLKESLI